MSDWRNMLTEAQNYEQNMLPGLIDDVKDNQLAERKRQKSALAKRGLLGSAYGRSSLGNIMEDQDKQMANITNQMSLQGANRKLDVAKFLGGMEHDSFWKNKNLEHNQYWRNQELKYKKSDKPSWFDHLLGGLGALGGGQGLYSFGKMFSKDGYN